MQHTPLRSFNFLAVLGHVGLSMFIFEGNAAIINVKSEVQNKKHFLTLMLVAVILIMVTLIAFGEIGYYTYKSDVQDLFTLNMVPINGFVTTTIVFLCVNAFISIPTQILAAFDIIEQFWWFKEGTESEQKSKRLAVRSLILVFVAFIATIIPNFLDFLNIVGALGAGAVGFILPCLIYNVEYSAVIGSFQKWFNIGIMFFGILGSLLSITDAVVHMVDNKQHHLQ